MPLLESLYNSMLPNVLWRNMKVVDWHVVVLFGREWAGLVAAQSHAESALSQWIISCWLRFTVGGQMTRQLLAIISPDCCDFKPGLFNPVAKEFLCPEGTVVRTDFQRPRLARSIPTDKYLRGTSSSFGRSSWDHTNPGASFLNDSGGAFPHSSPSCPPVSRLG